MAKIVNHKTQDTNVYSQIGSSVNGKVLANRFLNPIHMRIGPVQRDTRAIAAVLSIQKLE